MKYNVAQIVPKMGKHKGQTRYYAKPTPTRKIGFEEVIRDISEMSSLTSGDVRNAIDRLSYYLRRELAAGNTVQLGQIGTFRIIAASRHVEHEEQVTTAIIKRPRILLHLTKELRSATRELQLSVHNPKAKGEAPQSPGGSSSGGSDTGDQYTGGGGSGDPGHSPHVGL